MLGTIPVKKRKAVLGTESDKDGFTFRSGSEGRPFGGRGNLDRDPNEVRDNPCICGLFQAKGTPSASWSELGVLTCKLKK